MCYFYHFKNNLTVDEKQGLKIKKNTLCNFSKLKFIHF